MATTTVREVGRRVQRQSAAWVRFGVVSGLVVALYLEVVPAMVSDWWNDEGYSHGFLIAPLTLYIAWKRREVTLSRPVDPDPRGLAMTLVACLAYLAGKVGAEFFLTRISLVFLLAGLIWTFWGVRRLRTLFFPLVLFSTAVPLPVLVYNTIAAPLQLLASRLSTAVAQALGVAVYRDGNIIHLAGTSLGVAEACSGLRSASSLAVASLLLGYLFCSRLRTRTALLAMAVPTAIFVNVVRVSGTALLADYDAELASGFYHYFAGWLVFVAGFGVLLLEARAFKALLEREQSGGKR